MSRLTNSIDINISVDLPDGQEINLDVTLAAELYQPDEYRLLVEDTFARAARAVCSQLKTKDTP